MPVRSRSTQQAEQYVEMLRGLQIRTFRHGWTACFAAGGMVASKVRFAVKHQADRERKPRAGRGSTVSVEDTGRLLLKAMPQSRLMPSFQEEKGARLRTLSFR